MAFYLKLSAALVATVFLLLALGPFEMSKASPSPYSVQNMRDFLKTMIHMASRQQQGREFNRYGNTAGHQELQDMFASPPSPTRPPSPPPTTTMEPAEQKQSLSKELEEMLRVLIQQEQARLESNETEYDNSTEEPDITRNTGGRSRGIGVDGGRPGGIIPCIHNLGGRSGGRSRGRSGPSRTHSRGEERVTTTESPAELATTTETEENGGQTTTETVTEVEMTTEMAEATTTEVPTAKIMQNFPQTAMTPKGHLVVYVALEEGKGMSRSSSSIIHILHVCISLSHCVLHVNNTCVLHVCTSLCVACQ